MRPLSGSRKRMSSLSSVLLPPPVAPTSATVCAGRHREAHAAERRIAVVGEFDRIEPHHGARIGRHGCRRVRRQRGVEQRHHALHAGHGPVVQVGHVGQARQRPQQPLREVHERRVAAHADVAAQRQHAAVEQRGHEADQDRHADHRRDGSREADRVGVACGGSRRRPRAGARPRTPPPCRPGSWPCRTGCCSAAPTAAPAVSRTAA